MIKQITSLVVFATSYLINAQVGVNTENPQNTFHVNGEFQVTNEINVGGTESTKGNPGESGQILFSQGENKPPLWGNLDDINVPVEAGFINKSSSQSIVANVATSITFNTILLNLQNYAIPQPTNNSNSFKIVKSGYYQVTSYIHYNINQSGTATTTLTKNNSTIVSNVSGYSSLSNIDHNTTNTIFLNKDDSITLNGKFTSNASVSIASLSLQFLGN